jgi:hypothetical protein
VLLRLVSGGAPPTLTIGDMSLGPDGIQVTNEADYVPPAHGGGKCITGKDCFFFNGTCPAGACVCPPKRTGTFCQLEKTENVGTADLIERQKRQALQSAAQTVPAAKKAPENPGMRLITFIALLLDLAL